MFYVKELPTECLYCDAFHEREYDPGAQVCGQAFCGIENENIPRTYILVGKPKRPTWCPLKKIGENNEY